MYGGKYYHLDFILPILPQNSECYIEPFAGSAVVMINRQPSPIEVLNDRSKGIASFFKHIQDAELSEELIRQITLTPHAQAEFELCGDLTDDLTDMEYVRRFVIRMLQSYGGSGKSWRVRYSAYGRFANPVAYTIKNLTVKWRAISNRLRNTIVLNEDAVDVIKRQNDSNAVLYCDPPYVGHENDYDEKVDHEALASAMHDFKGFAAVSGYVSDDMEELFGDWHRIDSKPKVARSKSMDGGEKPPRRTESIWTNRNTPQQTALT